MKQKREFPAFRITKKGTAWVGSGHPWVYREEVTEAEPAENGALVDVISDKGRYLGTGFYSEKSRIAVRILSRNANDTFGDDFWRRRIRYALDYRKCVMGGDYSACRLIFGEADGFPGLTVDRFRDLLVTQVLSYGTECIREKLYGMLLECLREDGETIRGLYERNDVRIRALEGLSEGKGWYWREDESVLPVTEITENGILYEVDVENGQKTGFFLDQKYNRLSVSRISGGRRVLDCFTHTGSFALNAVKGGAEHVTAVDISASAIALARKNAERNGFLDRMDFLTADVFDLLPALIEKGGHPYDLIILDPPAFTKSRKTVGNAEKGYKEINLRAMRLLPRGGYLATASCSHFMPHELFEKMLKSASRDAGVELRQIEMRTQGPDHPILWNVPETDYLKFYLFQIV
ncbi:MAG: class I SAM-dependent rRNA methyltransferase [Lachnospiraceae bacterium]|nr:class I SAM-dependent rRNA methyltransferase [Lachnospiraceae bacterium]